MLPERKNIWESAEEEPPESQNLAVVGNQNATLCI